MIPTALHPFGRRRYDALCEYVESDGTQYVDTGVVPSHLHSARCTFQLRSPLNTSVDSTGTLFGCLQRWAYAAWCPVFTMQRNTIYNLWGNGESVAARNVPFSQNADTWNTITFSAGYTEVFGLRIGPNADVSAPRNTAFVFCCNLNGGPWGRGTAKRISLFRLYDNGVLVRDFAPCRVGTAGALYDRVSGAVFLSATSTPLIPGPDL